jgi:hypothetical protein
LRLDDLGEFLTYSRTSVGVISSNLCRMDVNCVAGIDDADKADKVIDGSFALIVKIFSICRASNCIISSSGISWLQPPLTFKLPEIATSYDDRIINPWQLFSCLVDYF